MPERLFYFRQIFSKGVILFHLALVGLLIIVCYPSSFGSASVPWAWIPAHVGFSLWFLDSTIWLPAAFLCELPIAIYCFRPVGRLWLLASAAPFLVTISALLIGTPYYIESVGRFPTSKISSSTVTHRDYHKQMTAGVFLLVPLVAAGVAPRVTEPPKEGAPGSA